MSNESQVPATLQLTRLTIQVILCKYYSAKATATATSRAIRLPEAEAF